MYLALGTIRVLDTLDPERPSTDLDASLWSRHLPIVSILRLSAFEDGIELFLCNYF